MGDPKNSMTISKRMNQRDMRKKKGYDSMTLRVQGDELHRNVQFGIGWTEEHCQHLDSLLAIDFSCSATRQERTRCENKYTHGVNGRRPKPGPMKKRADHPQAVNKVLVLRRQVENRNPYVPKQLPFRQRPIQERERLEQQWKR